MGYHAAPHASLGLFCGLYQFVPQTEGTALLFESEWLLWNSADLQVMVEGRLREMEKDPSSVQIVLEKDDEYGQTMLLEDESGPFLQVGTPDPISHTHSDSLDSVSTSVKQELQCTERNSEVSFAYEQFLVAEPELQDQLEEAKVEICTLAEKLEQQRLSEEKLMQSLSDAEEKVSELMSENNKLNKPIVALSRPR